MKRKKLIPAVFALCAAAAICVGCAPTESNEYDGLNAMLDKNYSQIVLTVTDTFSEDDVLTSKYTMKFTDGGMTVNYTVERFAEISLDEFAPAKTTLVGKAMVAGGEVIFVEGDEVELDAITAGTGLEFKAEYFENADLTGLYLKADVKNPSGFMGSELNCTEMKVNASFLEVFYEIQITYLAASGSRVGYKYDFSL